MQPWNPDCCAGCGQLATITHDTYKWCGECGHVFQTEEDLLALDRTWWGAHDLPIPEPGELTGEDIATCPCCTHDL